MLKNPSIIEIDGGILEGGGQVLRIALALSILQKHPIRVHNIRAGRKTPGLRPQHLKGLEIGQQISGGKLVDAKIGSTDITFYPEKINCTNINADIKTAGSVSLLLQVGLPCALFNSRNTTFNLRGGTNADMAPHIDYTNEVYKTILEKFGGTFNVDIIRRGYFPRGGGEICATVQPVQQLQAVEMIERGNIVSIWGYAFAAGQLPIDKAKQMANAASSLIQRSLKNVDVNIEWYKERPEEAVGTQLGITIFARTDNECIFGSCAVVPKGSNHRAISEKAATDLLEDLQVGGCVDRWAQDQIILLMALASGKSRIKCGELTLHTKTAIHMAQLLTDAKFSVTTDAGCSIIECEGIGFKYTN